MPIIEQIIPAPAKNIGSTTPAAPSPKNPEISITAIIAET